MNNSIKNKTVRGLVWSGIEKFSYEIIQFLVGIIMARLLLPSDYGVIGVLLVFISFSNLFIDGGLATALIQKNDRSNNDFNTAFLYNLFISVILYIIIYISAPFIASFYSNPEIKNLLRVLTIILIISPFSSIQITRFTIDLDFKTISISSVISGIFSGFIGIYLAYISYGVWALVFQQVIMNICKTLLLNFYSKWRPTFIFSRESFCNLFSFGYKLLLANFIGRVYDNSYPLIIGKFFPISILGCYTRARQYSDLPSQTLRELFMRVTFPIFASIKDDKERIYKVYRIYIESSSFIIFPVMFSLILISKPLILIMLTEKWIDVVPYLQLLSLGVMFKHLSAINLNLLFVYGRSDWALKLEILKKTIAFFILFVSLPGGIWGICLGQVIYEFAATILNSKYTRTLIGLSYKRQLLDYGKVWVIGCFSIIPPFFLICNIDNSYLQIIVGLITYILLYLFINKILKIGSLYIMLDLIKEKKSSFI